MHSIIRQPMAILGAGSYGTALAVTFSHNNNVILWGHDSEHITRLRFDGENKRYLPGVKFGEKLELSDSLDYTLNNVKYVIIAVPSHVYLEFLKSIKPYINKNHYIISATKGLDRCTGALFETVINEVLGSDIKCSFLSGPSFAGELAQGMPTALTLATKYREDFIDYIEHSSNSYLKIYLSDDTIGVQLGGAIKNIIAIAVGLSDGLGYGSNTRSALITRGLREIVDLGKLMGASIETFFTEAVLGDLILTSTDNQSRNRRYGLLLAKGYSSKDACEEIGQVVEGYYNTNEVLMLAKKYKLNMLIISKVYEIIYQNKSPRRAASELLILLRSENNKDV